MTPQQLHAELDARRRELGLRWWQVAVELDVSLCLLSGLRRGVQSQAVRERAPEWLARERRQALPRKE
ncbi:hypothetical protein [Nonomuraea angiospora]